MIIVDGLKFIVYASLSSLGLYYLKTNESFMSIQFYYGLFFYGLGFAIWLHLLRTYPLSIAFPVAASLLIISTQIIGIYVLKEGLSFYKIMGTFLIIAGVFLVYRENI